ncbi:glycosyltransferase, partial [Acinetobacter baumannii]
ILLPVPPPDLIPFAIDSVLGQTRRDFEPFIICDGAPDTTVAAVAAAAARAGPIQVLSHPQGERHGEAYRHRALLGARPLRPPDRR